jgi:energy-coupling factor transporter transmembrane protein EcfT
MKKGITAIKIILLLLINFFVFAIKNPYLLTVLFLGLAILLAPTKYSLLKRLKVVLPICLIILLAQIIFNSGVSFNQRLLLSYISSIRIIIVSLSVFAFLALTALSDIVSTFSFLPKTWLLLLTITCYLIPATLIESEHIRMVQKSRTVYKNKWKVVQNIASLFVPLLHRIFKRSEVISLTIVARSFE